MVDDVLSWDAPSLAEMVMNAGTRKTFPAKHKNLWGTGMNSQAPVLTLVTTPSQRRASSLQTYYSYEAPHSSRYPTGGHCAALLGAQSNCHRDCQRCQVHRWSRPAQT